MRLPIATALALAALTLPAAASAAQDPLGGVRTNVTAADRALDRAVALGGSDPASASRELARNRAATFRAARAASRLRRAAPDGRTKAAAARSIAGLEDRNVDGYLQLLPASNGGLQEAVALALRSALAARELALGQLSALVASLPEPARSTIARVIAAISAGSPEEIAGIASAMAVAPPQVRDILQQALDIAAQGVKLATDQLTAILPLLPEQARGPVQVALTRVTELLEMLRGLAGQLGNGTVPTGQLPALPGVPGVPGTPGAPALPGLSFPIQLPFKLPFLG